MLRKIITITLLAITSIAAYAQRILDIGDGLFKDSPTSTKVERSVIPTSQGYHITYDFNEAVLTPDSLFPETDIWHIEGFTNSNIPGEPNSPYHSDSFSIPPGKTANVRVINEEWVKVKSLPSPGRPSRMVSDTTGYTKEDIPTINNSITGWYPSNSVIDNGLTNYKGIDIVNIGLFPVQFNISTGEARVCKTLEYEIIFASKNHATLAAAHSYSKVNTQFDDSYLSATTLNWEWEKQQSINEASSQSILNSDALLGTTSVEYYNAKKYLILAYSSLRTPVEKFAKWKRTLGFDVSVAYKSNWSSSDVMEEISKYDELDYLLLIGSYNYLKGHILNCVGDGEDRMIISDFPYTLTDSESIVPKISVGRIPVDSSKDAETVLNKIIEYEKNPPSSESFYNSYLFMTSFLGSSTRATRRNSQTTYEISSYINSLGKDISNLFYATESSNPQFWSDYGRDENGYIIMPAPIPFEMQRPQYPWNTTTQDVIAEINKGYSQVFYFGHGMQQLWQAPLLNASHLKSLNNGNALPVVYSMACLTGDYSFPGCLSEKLLTTSNGGAVAVFGFTGSTLQVYTDIIATSFFNGMYPNPGMSPLINDKLDGFSISLSSGTRSFTELGDLQKFVLTKLNSSIPSTSSSKQNKQYEASILTLFGDPSMHVYLDTPQNITPTSLISVNKDFSVIDNNPNHVITLYYPSLDRVINTKGRATVNLLDTDKPIICVHAPGAIPAIYDLTSEKAASPRKTQENKIVKENRIWRYHSNFNAFMPPYIDVYVDLRFSGTTDIDGKEYANCYVSKITDEFSEETAALVAYMREEDGKVYARYIPSAKKDAMAKGIDLEPYAPMMASYSHDIEELAKYDVLLFDDSLELGDLLYSTPDRDISDVFTVTEMSDFVCDEITGRSWTLTLPNYEFYTYLEGIGSDFGLLPFPGAIPITYSADTWDLDLVLDKDGNKLFDASKVANSVSAPDADAPVISEYYTTLNGVKIDQPSSKGVYIRTQILENGKRRISKIMVK